MSAVHLWYDKIAALSGTFNILVTLHPWVSDHYRSALKTVADVYFIDDYEILPYILLADICIGDTNSLIAEFCMLDKPIITFRVPPTPRTLPDVIEMIERVSIRIDTFEELQGALKRLCSNPAAQAAERKAATRLFFDDPDGLAGKRAADTIISMMPGLAPQSASFLRKTPAPL